MFNSWIILYRYYLTISIMDTEQLYWRKRLCGCFHFRWLLLLISITKRLLEWCALQLYQTSLSKKVSRSSEINILKSTKNKKSFSKAEKLKYITLAKKSSLRLQTRTIGTYRTSWKDFMKRLIEAQTGGRKGKRKRQKMFVLNRECIYNPVKHLW